MKDENNLLNSTIPKKNDNLNKIVFPYIGLGLLLLFFCIRIWNLGITHTGDAIWFLAALQGKGEIISEWAVSQGRIFAFIVGPIMYGTLSLQDTTAGELIRVGSFAAFFIVLCLSISDVEFP